MNSVTLAGRMSAGVVLFWGSLFCLEHEAGAAD